MIGEERYIQNIKPIPVELVKIQVEFRSRMAYEKEHEVKLDVEEKFIARLGLGWLQSALKI